MYDDGSNAKILHHREFLSKDAKKISFAFSYFGKGKHNYKKIMSGS